MELFDYSVYRFCSRDWMEFVLLACVKMFLISFLFYDSIYGFFIVMPMLIFDYKSMKKEKLKLQKRKLTLQFKDMMETLVTSLNAGYSLEHAFSEAKKDLSLIYEKGEYIFLELEVILSGLKVNIPLEKLLIDLGKRSDIEDIDNFAKVVIAAKRSGGNLIRIIQKTVNSISDKIRVEEEIETLITAKKLEQKIMLLMPYGILLYLRLTTSDFLNPLYHNVIGVFVMTIFLGLIYIADFWAKKIMEIQV